MPEFFPFIPGTETSRVARQHAADASPLLGRYRAVPRTRNPPRSRTQNPLGFLSATGGRGSVHVGYGALIASGLDDQGDDDDSDEDDYYSSGEVHTARRLWRKTTGKVRDLWIAPKQTAVKRVVEIWWSRWAVLIFMPASLVSISWISLGDIDHQEAITLMRTNHCIGGCMVRNTISPVSIII